MIDFTKQGDALMNADMEPLVCIGCVRRVDALSDEAAGWVLVPHSVGQGDDHDDDQWKCPACASGSDEHFGDPERRLREADG